MSRDAVPPLVLASGSPRRAALLTMLGLDHEVLPTRVDERVLPGETPPGHVERLARDKARAAADERPGALVLAGDTVVVRDGQILGKPDDEDHAVAMLVSLAGRSHVVATGTALRGPRGESRSRVDLAQVRFRDFGEDMARAYVATGEPMDKAGAYGIQGLGAALVSRVEGDYYTVVGLPVSGVVELLEELGWRYSFRGLKPAPRA